MKFYKGNFNWIEVKLKKRGGVRISQAVFIKLILFI